MRNVTTDWNTSWKGIRRRQNITSRWQLWGGDEVARHNLGNSEFRVGNWELGKSRWLIARSGAGYNNCLYVPILDSWPGSLQCQFVLLLCGVRVPDSYYACNHYRILLRCSSPSYLISGNATRNTINGQI